VISPLTLKRVVFIVVDVLFILGNFNFTYRAVGSLGPQVIPCLVPTIVITSHSLIVLMDVHLALAPWSLVSNDLDPCKLASICFSHPKVATS
jgi:hypothetical protein